MDINSLIEAAAEEDRLRLGSPSDESSTQSAEDEDSDDDEADLELPPDDLVDPREDPTRVALRHLYDAVVVLLASGEVVSTTALDVALENAFIELNWSEK